MSETTGDSEVDKIIAIGERGSEAIDRANGRTLDRLMDAQAATFLEMDALALDDLARDLIRKDPT